MRLQQVLTPPLSSEDGAYTFRGEGCPPAPSRNEGRIRAKCETVGTQNRLWGQTGLHDQWGLRRMGFSMVYLQGTYRLGKATAAIDRQNGKPYCFQVPQGAVVVINGFHRERPMMEVLYAGRQVLMFEEDLLQRAQPVARAAHT